MELTQFCILAENLPQPQLTLEPPGVIKSGQSADLLCTAPSNYKGAIFYLYLHRNREHLQTLQATEDTHNVTFTLREVTASDSKGYVCLYQIILLDAIQASELSNVLYLTIIDYLPSPSLTLKTQYVIHNGQSADLQCTAPSSYQGATFLLYIQSRNTLLQTIKASHTSHKVIFTLRELTASDSLDYVCLYQNRTSETTHTSEPSNLIYMKVSDENYNTTSPIEPEEFPNAPSWIIPLVAGIIGGAVLVLSIILASCMVIRFQQKKRQEQRDRESVWVPQNMSPDWSITNNMAYSVDQNEHSGDGLPSPFMGNSEISEDIVEKPFSTFQT
ncbi:protein HIDE1 isoform X2 [Bombina bombina]|uniref:protein HIDE1 isoform X2 n=1 Tax=Bombina bombina TaxID=8345 RepID=UPI00235AF342|nr:protein HIDE1 isoform X2 [Bombina bombina]